jgi:hypothetical protein
MKNMKYSVLFGIALVCTILFAACDTITDTPEIYKPVKNGYGRISITLTGEEAARTVLPSMVFTHYVYTFTKTGGSGAVKTPDNEGVFTLEVGSYTVEVQAYIGDTEPYTLAASGVSSPFNIGSGSNEPVKVRLSGVNTTAQGKFSYTITWPENIIEAAINLQKWPDMETIPLPLVALPSGNGKTQTLQLDAGTYLLSVIISTGDLYAGINEAVHIKSSLTTVYTKDFVDVDLIAVIPPLSSDYTISGTGTLFYDGNAKTVSVTRKANTSPGVITVYYAGTGSTTYEKSITAPVNVGTYIVTFDVAAATGWNSAAGLPAGTLTISKSGPASWPTAAAITYGSPLSASVLSGGDTAAGSFAWTTGTTIPDVTNSGYSVTFTPFDTANYTVTTGTVAITVNKVAVTDAVAAPGLNRYAHNRILLSVTTTGYTIEYGISASNNAASAVWQSELLFTGLNPSTTYYFFARIAERPNYSAGPASSSLSATTRSSDVINVTTTTEWTDALAHIAAFGSGTAETPQTYTIIVSGNIPVAGNTSKSFGSVTDITVTLRGNGKLYLSSWGNIIRGAARQTIIIDSANLTLQGLKSGQNGASQDNDTPIIYCDTLELKNGEISGNYGGGGVYAGTFTMTGGTISGNYGGGGVCATTFTMTGGTISGNTDTSYSYSCGGGVYAGTFTMTGGTISGNNSYYGGGVYADTFTMEGGTISGNTNTSDSYSYGGYSYDGYSYGGGVYAGTFTMTGGTISGNTNTSDSYGSSYSYGGGVYVKTGTNQRFTKTGGIIYGNGASSTDKNTVTGTNACGHAVYYALNSGYYRDSTLGENDNLSSSSPMPANSGQTLNGWTKR